MPREVWPPASRGPLVYIHRPGETRSPEEMRTLHRMADQRGYNGVVVLPDNGRNDLIRAPGLVVGPGVTLAVLDHPQQET